MSATTSYATSPTSSRFLTSRTPSTQTPLNAQSSTANARLPSYAVAAEADAPLNLGLDEDEIVWGGESVGLGFGLLSKIKEKTNALLEEIDWDCRLCGNTATEPCVTRCGHLFCWSHLTKYLSSFPRCPTCTTPLAIDRDVVQVFGRPKVIPSDAPWTSVNHTPGSRGSTADPSVYEKTLNAANQLSPSSEGKENYDFSAPPPPASPIPIDTRAPQSRPSRLETSRTSSFDQFHKRRPLQPLSLIHRPNSCGSSSQENLHNPKPPVSLFVTNASSGSSSSLDINGKEAMEDNAWSAWRRASDTTTLVPTRRPSQFTRRMTDSPTPGDGLRPPSPQLRTKAFRPGWANARRNKLQKENNASTDSLDNDMRRSMEVRFTRGLSFDDSDAANGEDGSDVDRDSIYLHSPPKKTKPLGVPSSSLLFSNDEIHKPVARYAFDQPNAQSQRSPTGQHFVAGQRTNQNQWYTMNNQQHSHSVAQPSSKRTEMVPPSNFARLKAAVAEEQEKDSFLTDPLGRAMCVFAVVILVKILLK